ncbi:hypothetical protein ET475_08030 [Microbacterium protaetiae]|uniref:Amidohydrolase n=1 Tax=Microbacterium protaetiae TaxID=2509458 RepID=A0A4P6EPP5_9MICO|nr:hypothetical protein [Microbacterium protaetiae]QAY59948.1 hypothetical protein ET475_08030 [Microbacterium protaetiae]
MTHVDPERLKALLGTRVSACRRALTGQEGIALPSFIDHHLHLHLVNEHALPARGIAAALDLGGDPAYFARRPKRGIPQIAYAGAFLTVPGGYPTFQPWAPAQIVHMVTSPSTDPGVAGGARTSVDEMADAGASVIKVALNSAAGPVFDRSTLHAIIAAAHTRRLPVVVHVEGEGMTRMAVDAAADALAHTPFSEHVDDDLIATAVAAGQRWISTLTINDDPSLAIENLSRFAAAGGTVLYGTDLGNGPRHAGLLVEELQALHTAGVRGPALIDALTDPWPLARPETAVATFVAGPPPADEGEIPEWLGAATVVPTEELTPHEP